MNKCCGKERNRLWYHDHTKFTCFFCGTHHDSASSYDDLKAACQWKNNLLKQSLEMLKELQWNDYGGDGGYGTDNGRTCAYCEIDSGVHRDNECKLTKLIAEITDETEE